jgi:hypothetical protein
MGNYSATGWGKKDVSYDFKTPSGQLCLLRRPQIQDLMRVGMLENIDELTQIASKNIQEVKEPNKIPDDMKNPETMGKVFSAVDRIVQYVVLKPRILDDPPCNKLLRSENGIEHYCGESIDWHFENDADHPFEFPDPQDETVYSSWIELNDKVAIISEVTGPINQLAPFPGGQSENVGSVESSQELSNDTEPAITS